MRKANSPGFHRFYFVEMNTRLQFEHLVDAHDRTWMPSRATARRLHRAFATISLGRQNERAWPPVLFEFGECARIEADGVWLAGRERVPGAYLGFQDVFSAAEGEDGDLCLGFEVDDPVRGDPGPGVLADLAHAVYLLAAAARGDHLGD